MMNRFMPLNPNNFMKSKLTTILSSALALIFINISGCKEQIEPTVQELVTEQLVAAEAWTSPVVIVDGVDRSDLYKNFTIKFEPGKYASSGGAPIWPASGVWVFSNEEATVMRLDDKLDVTIGSISSDLLVLTLTWNETTFEPGRVSSIKGKQEFKLKKK
jgi:hypothetical protein